MDDLLNKLRPTQRPLYEALAEHGPMTDEQLQHHLDQPANKVCPRRLDLVNLGLVEQAGVASTTTGRRAKLWKVVPAERVADARQVAAARAPRRRTVLEASVEEKVKVVQALLKVDEVNTRLLQLQGRSAERARGRARGMRSQAERERRERKARIEEAERAQSPLLHVLKALRNVKNSEEVVRSVREFVDLDLEQRRLYDAPLIPPQQEDELRSALSDLVDLAQDARAALDGASNEEHDIIEGDAVEISELVLPDGDGLGA
jgi:predicted transcriptional regulator